MGGPAPGPRGLPLLGVLPQLARDAPTACTRAQQRYGHVVRLPVLRADVHLLTHPDHVEQVLVTANRNHWKGRMFGRTSFLFGQGLVLDDGESWQRNRRALSPPMSQAAVDALTPAVTEVVDARLDRWEAAADDGRVLSLETEMTRLTLAVVARSLLSVTLDEDALARLTAAFGTVLEHLGPRMATFALPSAVPVPGERGARRALAVIDALAVEVLDRRQADADPPADLLTHVATMPRPLARDQVVTMLFGGYEATAHALAWAFALLDCHPEVAHDLRDDRTGARAGQVAREVLRLYPPFWEVLRSSYDAQEVGGFDLPPAASVLLCPFTTHRLPELWSAPDAFRPERFAPGGEAESLPRWSWFPFGGGQRACIGQALALLEMRVVLTRTAARFRPRLVDPTDLRHRARSTLRSRSGLPVRIERVS